MTQYRTTLSAGSLVGDAVVNLKGDKIGKLEEIMLDVHTGQVAYAVLSFGGFLGVGDKLFALPWSALTVDEENKQLRCNISERTLERAPGFDKNNWPDFSNVAYRRQVQDFYEASA